MVTPNPERTIHNREMTIRQLEREIEQLEREAATLDKARLYACRCIANKEVLSLEGLRRALLPITDRELHDAPIKPKN